MHSQVTDFRAYTSVTLARDVSPVDMRQADKLFTDGEAYERLMGRWTRLVGEVFLDWLDVPKGLR